MAPRKPITRRSQRLAIYLLPNVEQDAIVLDVYNASRVHDRAQDLFRTAVFRGLRAMYESGDIPASILAHHNLSDRLGRRLARHAALAPPMPAYAPVQPPAFAVPPSPPPTQPVFEAAPPPPEEDEDPMDFLGLMGGAKPLTREEA